jgi:hypothetical protein
MNIEEINKTHDNAETAVSKVTTEYNLMVEVGELLA